MKKKYDVNFFFVLKVILLSIAFFFSLYTIYYLNTSGIHSTPLALLLHPESATVPPGQKSPIEPSQFKICSKELVALSLQSPTSEESWMFLKRQSSWSLLHKAEDHRFEPATFEGCRQKICQFEVSAYETKELLNFSTLLTYQFIDSSQTLIRLNLEQGVLVWEGKTYRAKALIDYLKDLPQHKCK